MRVKQTIIIFISIIIIFGGIILNFTEFINDYWRVNLKNAIVTLAYISIWILVLIVGIKNRYIRVIKFYSGFWFTTLILAILAIFTYATRLNTGWAILPAILVLSQWFGLKFFIESNLSIYIVISFISLSILTITGIFIHQNKNNQV